jgi:hypothetical protein
LVARSIRTAADQPLLYSSARNSLAKRSDSSVSAPASGQNPGTPNGGSRNDAGAVTKRRKRVVYLVFALALIFIGCWLPQNFLYIWQNFYRGILRSMRRHYRVYFIIKLTSHMLTYVNSSINPILYSLVSGQFRNRLAHAIFGSAFFHNTRSNRARHANDVLQAGVNNSGAANGAHFGRSKAGSFQPLLYTNNHSRVDDDAGYSMGTAPGNASRRSSRGVNATNSLKRCNFEEKSYMKINENAQDEAGIELASAAPTPDSS